VWAQTMAHYFGLTQVYCYSGGTEATAMFPKVAETLALQGFQIQSLSEGANPVYALKYTENEAPIICFSKTFDDAFNPSSHYAAIMTCSTADEGCPFIAGADQRLPIRYDDPKTFDGTELMDLKYQERSLEIAAEMYYVFSQFYSKL
jgi:arsenate reductase